MKANSFINGSSESLIWAKLGYLFGVISKWLSIFIVTITLIGIGQFAQYNNSYNDYRQNIISEWVDMNPERQQVATDFINNCLKSTVVKSPEIPIKKPVLLSDCAKQVSAEDLSKYIETKNVLHSLAWPLSLLDEAFKPK